MKYQIIDNINYQNDGRTIPTSGKVPDDAILYDGQTFHLWGDQAINVYKVDANDNIVL